MKIQDILFFVVLVVLFYLRKSHYFIFTGLFCLILAIPLFYYWIFFTADRLVWYAAAFFLSSILFSLRK